MAALRSDAVRSRTQILEAARSRPADDIRLNDLARSTGLGVGTVYRHFPTVISLLEALHVDALEELVGIARRITESPAPGALFVELIRRGVELQTTRDGLKELLISEEVSPEVRALREEFHRLAAVGLDAAVREGRIRPEVSMEQIQRLVCGVEYAVRLGDGHDQALLLDVMMSGLTRHEGSSRPAD